MPISVTCPRTGHQSKAYLSGFSLLELMVVLVLLGGITSLALPNLTRLYESINLKLERDDILNQLQSLGGLALASRHALIIPMRVTGRVPGRVPGDASATSRGNYIEHSLALPAGWHVELDRDLIVRANGVCLGAEVSIFHLGEAYAVVDLKAPYCESSI